MPRLTQSWDVSLTSTVPAEVRVVVVVVEAGLGDLTAVFVVATEHSTMS